ncbi:MAG: MMPL family transporter [Candidatus Dadabacteria bacterium]|nr:MMPL family transporter [Candidatus Dadabacteria bacterium]NIQ13203.1 MMPL family transporter [Candidatus Dadabacteria bacterium]
MKLVNSSIQKPVTVAVAVIFIILFGVISFFRIPVQLTPDVENPKITVDTFWRGASPFEVEREIVNEQEDELKSVEGLIELNSESSEDSGQVILEFEVGTDLDSKVVKVSNKLDQIKEYPDEADRPIIRTIDIRSSAMAWFILKPIPGNDVDINTYHDFADEIIKSRFERVQGVGSSNVFGGRERQILVEFNPKAIVQRGLTIRSVAESIDKENENFSAGSFDEGKRQYLVRTLGEYKSTKDIENIIISNFDGIPVYLRDIASVRLDYDKPDYAVRQNGEPSIAINVLKESGANSIEVKERLFVALEELNNGVLKENGLYLTNVYEETGYIKSAIKLVKQNLLIGGVLAIIILLLFLRSLSSTIIIGTAIPISVIGTFVVFELLGRTINVISLAGMSFAVGMVIDNSIVVLENIYRHMQMGKNRLQASYEGTTEVWGAVLASTLTTAAVFLPIVFVKEQAGQLFRDIAIAITVSVILSLIVSITVIPTAASKILNIEKSGKSRSGILSSILNLGSKVSQYISDFTSSIIGNISRKIMLVIGFTLVSLILIVLLFPKTEYLPTGNRNLVFGILIPPPGYNLEEFTSIGKKIEADLKEYIDKENREKDLAYIKNFFYVARGRSVFMGAVAENEKRIKELIPVLQNSLKKIPGMIAIVTQSSLFRRAVGESRSVKIQITGPDLIKIVETAKKVFFMSLQKIPGAQVRPIPSLDLGNPELQIITDRERASEVGITNEELGYAVRSLIDGVEVSEYNLKGEEIDIVLRADQAFSKRTQDIKNIMINSSSGDLITLGSVSDINLTNGPEQINHFERQRTIAIQINPPEEVTLEETIEIVNNDILLPLRQGSQVDKDINFILAGTADDLTVARKALQSNFLLALVISFLLMASLFESFIYPLVIMFSVPFASLGGFLGLKILNIFTYQPLDILTMLGFVILIGIVINNAILIVHQSLNNIRDHGMDGSEAIRESVKSRIRPIFMSTLTSVFGMLPLVLAPGAGSELYRGLGSVIVGGLILSTIFTIILVPSVFSLVLDIRKRLN